MAPSFESLKSGKPQCPTGRAETMSECPGSMLPFDLTSCFCRVLGALDVYSRNSAWIVAQVCGFVQSHSRSVLSVFLQRC